jgi:hypothetical protein
MTSFLNFDAFAATRGEGLRPELRALFERVSTAPRCALTVRNDGMVQSGPDPISADVTKEPANVSLFPQAAARQKDEANQDLGKPARPVRKNTRWRARVRLAVFWTVCAVVPLARDLASGDHAMRYLAVLFLFLPGTASSYAETLMEKFRLAQAQTFAECISNCNSNNFSCAQNCGLSGSCVAQCNTMSAACKSGCNGLK